MIPSDISRLQPLLTVGLEDTANCCAAADTEHLLPPFPTTSERASDQ